MIQSRTHNCNELRIGNVGERVTLVGWFENIRKVSKNLGFVILRDFYGDRKSTRLNSSHASKSRMPSSA